MEIVEKGKTISIRADQTFPLTKLLVDSGIIVILIWAIFAVLVIFFSQSPGELLPYFIAITLLLLVPLSIGIPIRQSRQYKTILFDGESKMLSIWGMWRSQEIPFDQIKEFQVSGYRFKRNVFLYRLEVVLSSGKVLRLIQDVPDQEALSILGEKVEDLVKKPVRVAE